MTMVETSTSPWPEDFFDFAFVPAIDERLEQLKNIV
jgi:hypothetical protein